MEEEDKENITFTTQYKLYEYNVMPFGLKNTPAIFQWAIDKIFGEYIDEFVIVYIDDILICSNNSFEKHLEHIKKVFGKLREASMKLKLTKCKFCLSEIKYLGHIVERNGLKSDPGRIEKIKNIKRPTTVKELRSVLGLFNYYRKFMKKFLEKAKPMNKLLRKGIKFE